MILPQVSGRHPLDEERPVRQHGVVAHQLAVSQPGYQDVTPASQGTGQAGFLSRPDPPHLPCPGHPELRQVEGHGLVVGRLAPDLAGVLQAEVGDDQPGAEAEKGGPVVELLQVPDVRLVEGPEVGDLPQAGADLASELGLGAWVVCWLSSSLERKYLFC